MKACGGMWFQALETRKHKNNFVNPVEGPIFVLLLLLHAIDVLLATISMPNNIYWIYMNLHDIVLQYLGHVMCLTLLV